MDRSFFVYNKKWNTLFNLGLHMDNNYNFITQSHPTFSRFGNKALIQNPVKFLIQLTKFIRIICNILENGGAIAVFNNEGASTDYFSLIFEEAGVKYYSEPWHPGLISNPIYKEERPTLVVLVSMREA